MIALALIVAAASAPAAAPSPADDGSLDEVRKLDVVLSDILRNGPKAKAMFATDAELLSDFKSLGDDAKQALLSVQNARALTPPATLFIAVDAVVEPATLGASHRTVFFDSGGRSVTVTVHARADHTFALFGPAEVEDRDLRKYTRQLFDDAASARELAKVTSKMAATAAKPRPDDVAPERVQHFVKRGGAWGAGPALAAPKETCEEHAKGVAKALYVAEITFFAENDRYATKIEQLDVAPETVKAARVTIAKADAASFRIEVAYAGGTTSITEKNDFKVVTPCKESP